MTPNYRRERYTLKILKRLLRIRNGRFPPERAFGRNSPLKYSLNALRHYVTGRDAGIRIAQQVYAEVDYIMKFEELISPCQSPSPYLN